MSNEKMKQQAIEILQNTESPECMGLIRQFVWANTAKPKYKVGDVVQFKDPSTSILRMMDRPDGTRKEERQRVFAAVGKVKEIRQLLKEQTFLYTLEYETDLEGGTICGKTITNHRAARLEDDLKPAAAYAPTKWSELRG